MAKKSVKRRVKKVSRHYKTVQEYLGVPANWPVVEKLKHHIMIMPNERDINKAKPHDPLACALHNAACRIYSIPTCAIGGRWAYIPQRDERGKYYIARMQATQQTQKAIRKFDADGTMPLGGFEFRPIAPSHHLLVKRRYNKKWYLGEIETTGKKRKHTAAFKVRRHAPKFVVG